MLCAIDRKVQKMPKNFKLNSTEKVVAKVLDPRVTNLGSVGEAFVAAARKAAK
jgi:hypothetical protein